MGLNHGLAGTLVKGGFIRQDNTQPLLDGFGRVLAGLSIEPFGPYEDPTCLIDKNRDGLYRLCLHQNLKMNRAIGQ